MGTMTDTEIIAWARMLGDTWHQLFGDDSKAAYRFRRLADLGCHAISCHPDAYRFGAPDYHGDEWDPAWEAANETGTVMVLVKSAVEP